jgi:hypothetical protein
LIAKIFKKRIARETKLRLTALTAEKGRAARNRTSDLLRRLAEAPGPHAVLGETPSGEKVTIPIRFLATAWGVISGGTGSGKSMTAAEIIEALLAAIETDISFGLLDAKGETFERAIFLIARLLDTLPPAAAERLRRRLVIIDFSSVDPITSFSLAAPWSGADLDYFATSRMETLSELFPSSDGVSLRGSSILKHTIKVLAEQRVPFSYADQLLNSDAFRARLLSGSKDDELRQYFESHFPSESRATVAALRARLTATLFSSASLKLALAGATAPDFKELMDTGAIVLVNCAGANIPRATARTLQSLVVADIRQAVFNREIRTPYLWICDEAQHLFRTKYLRDHMTDLLTMSRSFGVHGLLITQNLTKAVQDAEVSEILHTNTKWALVLRGSAKDAVFLKPAFPVSGRCEKPRSGPYALPDFYSISEERNLILQEVAHLPDREAWCWIKSLTGEAFRFRTRTMDIPTDAAFQELVDGIRRDPTIGRRSSRVDYLEDIRRRDAEWKKSAAKNTERDFIGDLTELYRAGEDETP